MPSCWRMRFFLSYLRILYSLMSLSNTKQLSLAYQISQTDFSHSHFFVRGNIAYYALLLPFSFQQASHIALEADALIGVHYFRTLMEIRFLVLTGVLYLTFNTVRLTFLFPKKKSSNSLLYVQLKKEEAIQPLKLVMW